ncbi:hypothetical protein [Helicobacter bilis]|nr:hypothetical protein [Helicobacter bilis]
MAEGKGATLQIQAPSHQKSGKWKMENGKIGGLCENRTRRHPKYCKK